MTNYEKIKNMSLEEVIEILALMPLIQDAYFDEIGYAKASILSYLESEVTND